EKTLRAYSTRPINLKRFDRVNWMTTEEDLWEVCEYFCVVQHSRVMPPEAERKRRRMDRRLYEAGMVGAVEGFSCLCFPVFHFPVSPVADRKMEDRKMKTGRSRIILLKTLLKSSDRASRSASCGVRCKPAESIWPPVLSIPSDGWRQARRRCR